MIGRAFAKENVIMRIREIIAVLVIAVTGCGKGPGNFAQILGGPSALDVDPIQFINLSPSATLNGPFNINSFGFEPVDLPGSNGVVPRGVDFSSIQAKLGSNDLSIVRNGDRYTGSLTGVPDGQLAITLSGKDLQGNAGTGVLNFRLKRTGPVLNFTQTPVSPGQSAAASVDFTYGGMVTDPFLGPVVGSLYRAGTDNQCGTADDQLWPKGNGPGEVSENTWTYAVGVGGAFQVGFTAYNGVSPGGQASLARYCMGFTASDLATDADGVPNPNTTTRYNLTEFTWQPPTPPAVNYSVTGCHRHVGSGNSFVRFTVTGTPASSALGLPYSFQVTGPGVVGPANHAGTMPAGPLALQTNINLFGIYNLSGTVGGTAVSGSDNVDASQTCPP